MPESNATIDARRAVKAQVALASKARVTTFRRDGLSTIGGVDVAYSESVTVVAYAELNLGSGRTLSLTKSVPMPKVSYQPGFLAFREAGPVLDIMRELKVFPQLMLINGHGLAHPRLCGLATHLGVVLKLPTIGLARGVLGSPVSTYNRLFCQKEGGLYISPGNLISFQDSVDIVNSLPKKHGYPEPLGSAHHESKRALATELREKG
ncbi:MAG TPA: endonuclease V [Thermoproteota archaeon]|nr:endonuclease V [Thermoproteota archaeon]